VKRSNLHIDKLIQIQGGGVFSANSEIFQLYHDENKLIPMRWWWCPLCTRPTRLLGFFW